MAMAWSKAAEGFGGLLWGEVVHAVLSPAGFTPGVCVHHATHDIHVHGVLGKELMWLFGALQEP